MKAVEELPELLRRAGYLRESVKVYIKFQAVRLSRELLRGEKKHE